MKARFGLNQASSDDKAKPNPKKIAVYVLTVLGLGFILFMDDFMPQETEVEPQVVVDSPAKRAKKKREEPIETTTEASQEPTTSLEEVSADPAKESEVVVTETPVIESPKEEPKIEEQPTKDLTAVPNPEEETTITETPIIETTETNTIQETEKAVSEVKPDEPIMLSDVGETSEEDRTDENMTDKILDDLEKQVSNQTKEEQKKEYVSPPNYEYGGRGLVYNCSGKHWACVDAPSYKICQDNSSSTSFLKKKKECHPYNVYQTVNGCATIQNQFVSTGKKIDFCD